MSLRQPPAKIQSSRSQRSSIDQKGTTLMLNVTLYPDAEDIKNPSGGTTFEVDYVSLVNNQTYGPPALVAPSPRGADVKRARTGEKVLYINTNVMPAFEITEVTG